MFSIHFLQIRIRGGSRDHYLKLFYYQQLFLAVLLFFYYLLESNKSNINNL